ncbi:hypothetical protein KCU67_g11877, partial [Aureobasidium melanogenum]
MAELSEEPMSDHSDESLGIPYYGIQHPEPLKDLAHWRANMQVIDGHQADADDEMDDDTDSDDENDEDQVTATNYALTPRVLRALKKSLPPHLLEALKNGSKNAAEDAQVAKDT